MFRSLTTIIVLTLSIGCGEEKDPDPSWKEALSDLESGNPIFSFIFVDEPPDGTLVRADIFEGKIGSPCDLHRPDADLEGVTPFWYMSIKMGSVEPGTYEIAPFFDELEDRDKAGVALNYVKNEKSADRYFAVGGTVELTESPANSDEWHDGVKLNLTVNVEFPEKIMKTGACEIDRGNDGF